MSETEALTPTAFPAEAVFYDAPAGQYFVDTGKAYHRFGKVGPIKTGITRYRMNKGEYCELAKRTATQDVANRELDGAVQWSGMIAGHRRGIQRDQNGLPILITSQANLPEPQPGSYPVISDILRQAFPDETPRTVFFGWLATRFRAVREGIHVPAPMMVLAGEVNAGKSLLAWITGQVLGGRTASPHAAWSGGMLWNDDLVGCELLLVDDATASTDIRARRNFGANFKESIYSPVVQLRKRNTSSISVRPVWAVMVCCNSTPESLQIIPPLDADLSDKVALLKTARITPPMDTSTPDGKKELQRRIRAELPAFAHALLSFTVPEELGDSRSGIAAWRDAELEDAVDATGPERRLESLLEIAFDHHLWHDLPATLSAAQIETRLIHSESPVRDLARHLFLYPAAAGKYLAKLAREGSPHVQLDQPDRRTKTQRYRLQR
jgi:hypothetical protein